MAVPRRRLTWFGLALLKRTRNFDIQPKRKSSFFCDNKSERSESVCSWFLLVFPGRKRRNRAGFSSPAMTLPHFYLWLGNHTNCMSLEVKKNFCDCQRAATKRHLDEALSETRPHETACIIMAKTDPPPSVADGDRADRPAAPVASKPSVRSGS